MRKRIDDEDIIAREAREIAAANVVAAAFQVHSVLGPGLLESAYERCLQLELERRGSSVRSQIVLPIRYEGLIIDAGYRLDMIVDDRVIVEIKSTEFQHPVHIAQLLTYLKLTRIRLGLLVNFNTPLIKDGIRRVVL